jgi:hypothetical protein
MNPSELRALIRESLVEVTNARPYADQETDKERFKQLASRPKPPTLSPEQAKETVREFDALPRDRKDIIAGVMKHPCASCEQELKIPNVGWSHGICPRHWHEFRNMMKMPPKEPVDGNTMDIKNTLSPEEIKLAVNLFAVAKAQGSKF